MATPRTILILDDEPERIRAMTALLSNGALGCDVVTFDNAPDMIDWLRKHLEDVSLICLDHDLGPNRCRDGNVFDPGTGRDVADYLASRSPVCPVLIHTTNSLAAPGMAMVLDDSGWLHSRVVPYNDLEWVSADWIDVVRKALGKK
jgi:CheY-like chemotaxis protein